MGRKNSKSRKQKQKRSVGKTLKGKLEITRSGMGFVIVEGLDGDVLIRPSDFNTALHGDTVRIRIKDGHGRRQQGVVEEVLQRKRNEFIGRLEMNKGFGFFIAEMDKPMPDIFIPLEKLNSAKDNDRVVVKILEWERGGKRPIG
jgi:ribonuclease R